MGEKFGLPRGAGPYVGRAVLSALLLLGLQLAGAAQSPGPADGEGKSEEAFALFKSLSEGELQQVVKFNGTCAREIILDWGETYLSLRELWFDDEPSLKLSFFYKERILTDCTEEVIKPEDEYEHDVCGTELRWLDNPALARQVKVKVSRYGNNSHELTEQFPWILDSRKEMRERCAFARAGKLRKNDGDATEPKRKDDLAVADTRREKRGIRELVIAPGTKWCGPHRLAYSYKDLGALDGLDRCCRRHDHCPQAISPFSEKYGLFNYMPFTLSHCACDERFRTCLKMTDTSSANLIGKIFFNMVQTKCFYLKPTKVCVKRSWYGKCEKHKYKKQGHLRDNTSY